MKLLFLGHDSHRQFQLFSDIFSSAETTAQWTLVNGFYYQAMMYRTQAELANPTASLVTGGQSSIIFSLH